MTQGMRGMRMKRETRETDIPPDSPTANTEVSRPSQMTKDVDVAPPVCVDEATFDIGERQNSNSVSFFS